MMILFIAPNPHKVEMREGFLQRVAAVDKLFVGEEKVYFEDYKTTDSQADVIGKADLIYVHSIYSAKWIRSVYPLLTDKLVTDLHGVVPEEEELQGNADRARIMSEVEAEVFTFCKTFVAVSEEMTAHYNTKYSLGKEVSWIILPIFDESDAIDIAKKNFDYEVVYAGGTQQWQNVDKMMEAINESNDYRFTILTHNPDGFSHINQDKQPNVVVKTVPSSEVSAHYHDASLGFLLRDSNIVNRVACPTKLIEYLGNGVVPIVLSPAIGDAKRLGYSYITLQEFKSKKISKKRLKIAAERNMKVYEDLRLQSGLGRKELIQLVKERKPLHRASHDAAIIRFYLGLYEAYENDINELWRHNDIIQKKDQELRMSRDIISDQKEAIDRFNNSKVGRIIKFLRTLKGE